MHRHRFAFAFAFGFGFACLVIAGCSSEAPKNPASDLKTRNADAGKTNDTKQDTDTTEPPPDTAPSSTPAADPPPPPAPPDAGAPPTADCALGDGLYCGGNGVNGAANELYRCSGGVATLEQTCTGDCAKMPDGINDVCSCALGDGLYCGGNGVNGDANTLFRCSGGAVAVEKKCANGCSKQPDGFNDKCL